MKKCLFFISLAIMFCSVNLSAQTKKPARKATTQKTSKANPVAKDSREYQVGKDGFEWYKVCKNGKYGAESRDGKLLIPTEYDFVYYHARSSNTFFSYPAYFEVHLNSFWGAFSTIGRCIIPTSRQYTGISIREENLFGTYYMFQNKDGAGICNANGIQLALFPDVLWVFPASENNIFYYELQSKGGLTGIGDANGNVVVKTLCQNHVLLSGEKFVSNGTTVGYVSSMSTTVNPFVSNSQVYHSSSSSPSNSSSSSNSGNNTTTIHVEHHHDPVPVQEWQQCNICYGSGNCGICGGNGWNPYSYANGRYVKCISCGGNGRCSYCAGRGGKNITVYR